MEQTSVASQKKYSNSSGSSSITKSKKERITPIQKKAFNNPQNFALDQSAPIETSADLHEPSSCIEGAVSDVQLSSADPWISTGMDWVESLNNTHSRLQASDSDISPTNLNDHDHKAVNAVENIVNFNSGFSNNAKGSSEVQEVKGQRLPRRRQRSQCLSEDKAEEVEKEVVEEKEEKAMSEKEKVEKDNSEIKIGKNNIETNEVNTDNMKDEVSSTNKNTHILEVSNNESLTEERNICTSNVLPQEHIFQKVKGKVIKQKIETETKDITKDYLTSSLKTAILGVLRGAKIERDILDQNMKADLSSISVSPQDSPDQSLSKNVLENYKKENQSVRREDNLDTTATSDEEQYFDVNPFAALLDNSHKPEQPVLDKKSLGEIKHLVKPKILTKNNESTSKVVELGCGKEEVSVFSHEENQITANIVRTKSLSRESLGELTAHTHSLSSRPSECKAVEEEHSLSKESRGDETEMSKEQMRVKKKDGTSLPSEAIGISMAGKYSTSPVESISKSLVVYSDSDSSDDEEEFHTPRALVNERTHNVLTVLSGIISKSSLKPSDSTKDISSFQSDLDLTISSDSSTLVCLSDNLAESELLEKTEVDLNNDDRYSEKSDSAQDHDTRSSSTSANASREQSPCVLSDDTSVSSPHDASSASPRKKKSRQRKGRHVPAFLDEATKEQSQQLSWNTFEPHIPKQENIFTEPQMPSPSSTKEMRSSSSQSESYYFSFVYRLNSSAFNNLTASDVSNSDHSILTASSLPRGPSQNDIPVARRDGTSDQSTETDETLEQEVVDLQTLQSCFPEFSKRQLEDTLTLCHNDLEWVTNQLLESPALVNYDDSEEEDDMKKPNKQLSESEMSSKPTVGRVPTLSSLCSAVVTSESSVDSDDLEMKVIQAAQSRLATIENFNLKRLLSLGENAERQQIEDISLDNFSGTVDRVECWEWLSGSSKKPTPYDRLSDYQHTFLKTRESSKPKITIPNLVTSQPGKLQRPVMSQTAVRRADHQGTSVFPRGTPVSPRGTAALSPLEEYLQMTAKAKSPQQPVEVRANQVVVPGDFIAGLEAMFGSLARPEATQDLALDDTLALKIYNVIKLQLNKNPVRQEPQGPRLKQKVSLFGNKLVRIREKTDVAQASEASGLSRSDSEAERSHPGEVSGRAAERSHPGEVSGEAAERINGSDAESSFSHEDQVYADEVLARTLQDEAFARSLQDEEDSAHSGQPQPVAGWANQSPPWMAEGHSAGVTGYRESPSDSPVNVNSVSHILHELRGTRGKKLKPAKYKKSIPVMNLSSVWHDSNKGKRPERLSSIMEEEREREDRLQEKLSSLQALDTSLLLATKLKRRELGRMYPTLNPDLLDEVFFQHDCSKDATVTALTQQYGLRASPLSMEEEEGVITTALRRSREDWGQAEYYDEEDDLPGETLTYDELRSEAHLYRRLAKECTGKAHRYQSDGMQAAAFFYRQQVKKYKDEELAANQRASEVLFEKRHERLDKENTLDLHMYHLEEAKVAVDRAVMLKEEENERYHGSRTRSLFVITGKGIHSKGGVARLKPGIVSHLRSRGMRFEDVNEGLIKVTMGQRI